MINQKVLLIDTSDNSKTIVGLIIDGKEYLDNETFQKASQNLLPMVMKLLKKHKIGLKDLTGIKVNTGPGSFTGLRVGVAVANTLSYLLKIPINDKKVGEIVVPDYEYNI